MLDDPFHLSVQDRVEDGEERWQTLGQVGGVTVPLEAHTVAQEDPGGDEEPVEVIHVVSARKAERHERRRHEDG